MSLSHRNSSFTQHQLAGLRKQLVLFQSEQQEPAFSALVLSNILASSCPRGATSKDGRTHEPDGTALLLFDRQSSQSQEGVDPGLVFKERGDHRAKNGGIRRDEEQSEGATSTLMYV